MAVAELAGVMDQVGPAVEAALVSYGTAVLTRAEDAALDATANLGRRALRAVWDRLVPGRRTALEEAVADVAEAPGDQDALAALRQQIRRALREDPQLLAELAGALPTSGVTITASGTRAVAAQHIGVVVTGDHTTVQR